MSAIGSNTATSRSNSQRPFRKRRAELFGATALLLALMASPGAAQGLQPGEAFATRFSGITQGPDGGPWINPRGTVGSILDLRAPLQPPQGQHWINEPQRAPITAAQVGQVFGVAFDDATPPNIYVTATAAFGLHRTSNNAQWMPGMFGEGGPGAIYRLDASNGYQPRLFAVIALNGRPNSGAALGNIAYDRWNRQFLVSDLETGMIHRIGLDGRDRGSYDHGVQGRTRFVDAQSGQPRSLPPILFNPTAQARIANCESRFDTTPECWNVAESNRRVWGLGVWRGPNGETRLYYSVASSPDLGGADWNSLPEDEKRNSLWSARLGPDGSFDPDGVRREATLPDFFANPADIARAGYSRPVSDITFPACSGRPIMLVAERGGLRNLGLGQENAFATPHEARTIRYELDQGGTWRAVGRYDIGMYDRSQEGAPNINANCAGGAAFGPGYTLDGRAAPGQADQFVWLSGDRLCSPEGPCNVPGGQAPVQQVAARGGPDNMPADDSQVHGLHGQSEDAFNAVQPTGQPTPIGPDLAYMIDLDLNLDQAGRPIPAEATRNDATMIGDISVYQICPVASAAYSVAYPLMAVGFVYDHHHRYWSGGHWRYLSPIHRRHLSPIHHRHMSPIHQRQLSPVHRRQMSPTHQRHLSPIHQRQLSPVHRRHMSPTHSTQMSPGHSRSLSPTHKRGMSPTHLTHVSQQHSTVMSNSTPVPNTHLRALSMNQVPKSNLTTHQRGLSPAQHNPAMSNRRPTGGGMGGTGGMGMGGVGTGGMGGMGNPKALNQRITPIQQQQRIGPQQFRGGPGFNR